MQIKLSDVLGQAFVALPMDQLFDSDGSYKVAMANVFGKPDPAVQSHIQMHSPEPETEPAQEPQPVVTIAVACPGVVIPPWEKEKALEVDPVAIVKEEARDTEALQVPWKNDGKGLPNADRGLPEGWAIDDPSRMLEHHGEKFVNQQDADDWVIAKGRALPYSLKDESRPDPFDVSVMYKWIKEGRDSPLIQHRITSFRAACRHAIAVSVMYYDQDIERFESAQRAEKESLQSNEAEAAKAKWKQAVEERRIQLAELDRKVTEARDAWHALRK